MSGWQPIETAPKDETWVLVVRAPFVPMVAKWVTHGQRSRWSEDPESHAHEACWLETFDWDWEPTHWQPLPAPPSSP